MITVEIGEEERSLQEATEQWTSHQIPRRRADSQAIYVRVSIRQGGLGMTQTWLDLDDEDSWLLQPDELT